MLTIDSIAVLPEHITQTDSPPRLLDYLIDHLEHIHTRNGIKKALKKGEFLLNQIPATGSRFVYAGDIIDYIDLNAKKPKHFPLVLDVIFEDEFMAVVYKPAGFPVSGNAYKTIENALEGNLMPSQQKDRLPWPRPVHRLDSPTTGLLVVAKTKQAQVALGDLFENKKIHKTYYAVAMGALLQNSGSVDLPIEGRPALSHYEVIKVVPSLRSQFLSLVKLSPVTGRTHQLRIHLNHLGCPILGDKTYGNEGSILQSKGLFLSSVALDFIHPITQETMHLEVPLPAKFLKYMEGEEKRFLKYMDVFKNKT